MMKKVKIFNAIVKYLLVSFVSLGVLIISSGNLSWVGAWTIFGFDCLYLFVLITIGMKYFPETVSGRKQTKFIYTWDKIAILIYLISYYSQYLISGLTLRFSLSSFHLLLYATGSLLFAIGLGITFWVFATNPYATGSSRIQEERGQKLVTKGPYRFIRHPMYFSIIIFTLSVPLILCSMWAFLPAPLVIASFIYRCSKEDALLSNELEGYKEYKQKVKYRMIPSIW
jgi:protein-S-isoprenylcysteine O-methyltransferase Ste14